MNVKNLCIVHLVSGGAIGGAERFLTDMISATADFCTEKNMVEHIVAVQSPNFLLHDYFKKKVSKVESRYVKGEGGLAYLANSFSQGELHWLTQVCQKYKAHLIHAHTFQSHVLSAMLAKRLGLPLIRTEHHVMHFTDWSSKMFTRYALPSTSKSVAISRYVESFLRTNVKHYQKEPGKLELIPNGVNTSFFASKQPYPKAENKLKCLVACRLEPWKRIHLFLQALPYFPMIELFIAGMGPEEKRLKKIAKKMGLESRVHFLGYMQDIRICLEKCELVLSAAKDEPFGLSVGEGLSYSRPVLAISGGGIDEMVDDGKNGFLISDPSPKAIQLGFERALEARHKFENMGEEGRKKMIQEYSIEKMTRSYLALYQKVVFSC